VQALAEGGHDRGVVRQEPGPGNTSHAGAVGIGNTDSRKAIKLRTCPNREEDKEQQQSAHLRQAESPRTPDGYYRNYVPLTAVSQQDLQPIASERVDASRVRGKP
jgi:hypothetical protein